MHARLRSCCPLLVALAATFGLIVVSARPAQAQPIGEEDGWVLTQSWPFTSPRAAHYNPIDGLLYVALDDTVANGGGLYRIEADNSATFLAAGDRIAAVTVDHETGDIYMAEDFGGGVFRTKFGATGRTTWVSGFHSGDDDPVGMAVATSTWQGDVLAPGEVVVVDRGNSGADEIWIFSTAAAEGERVLHQDNGQLGDATDITLTTDRVFVADNLSGTDGVWEVFSDGSLLLYPMPFNHLVGITADPLNDELLILDSATDTISRFNPDTGILATVISGFTASGANWAGIDITPDGSRLFLTDDGAGMIYEFTRDPSVHVTTESPVDFQFGTTSSLALEARLGRIPYTWSITEGELPPGLALSEDGVLSGEPIGAGTFPITVRVDDSFGDFDEKAIDLEVALTRPEPDILLDKVGSVPVPGRVSRYFILVGNAGTQDLAGIRVIEFLDPVFSFVSASEGATRPDPSEIHWTIPTLGPGEVVVKSYEVRVKRSAPIGSEVLGGACAGLDSDPDNEDDPDDPFDPDENLDKCKEDCDKACKGMPQELCAERCKVQCKHLYHVDLIVQITDEPNPKFLRGRCRIQRQILRRSKDPNHKIVSPQGFIAPQTPLSYMIEFENVGDIEARDVFLTDDLDADLDLTTLRVGTAEGQFVPISDGETVVLKDETFVETQVVAINGIDVVLETPRQETWTVERANRQLRWELLGIDLAPKATSAVFFRVTPSDGLGEGTEIRNHVDIQFEIFETITTEEAINVIDGVAPVSDMDPLPPSSPPSFVVSWSGIDAVSGITNYSLYVSADGGPWTPYIETPATSLVFPGEANHLYDFVVLAQDAAGNREAKAAVAEASTFTDGIGDPADADGDGIGLADVCPEVPDPGQEDLDEDAVGDACDRQTCGNAIVERPSAELDDIGVDFIEQCDDGNRESGDGCSAACEIEDPDGDGVGVLSDNCPQLANADQSDGDGDGVGDVCDVCPGVPDAGQEDLDRDGSGDACDDDDDADGLLDTTDNCPRVPNADQADLDGDGLGSACDLFDAQSDVDGDTVHDGGDNCPFDANLDQADGDGDGIGDACDNCLTIPNRAQIDLNENGIGDICDRPGHFTAYKASPTRGTEKFRKFGPVALADVLGSREYEVVKKGAIAISANHNDEGFLDAGAHFAEYKLKIPRGALPFARRSGLRAVDPCIDALVELLSPSTLMVPSALDASTRVEAPESDSHDLDHLLCYKAKPQRKLADGTKLPKLPKGMQVEVADGIQERRYDLKRISKVCLPTGISGTPSILSGPEKGAAKPIEPTTVERPENALICYRAKIATKWIAQDGCVPSSPGDKGVTIEPTQPKDEKRQGVFVADQFGDGQVDPKKLMEICMPSQVVDTEP